MLESQSFSYNGRDSELTIKYNFPMPLVLLLFIWKYDC